MAAKKGLSFTIELSPEEAREFCRRAQTDDDTRYEGIAKALVLGAGKVVVPEEVASDVDLLVELVDYGACDHVPALQEWADELSYTRAQLESEPVRKAIKLWSTYWGAEIAQLADGLGDISLVDQFEWTRIGYQAEVWKDELRKLIARRL